MNTAIIYKRVSTKKETQDLSLQTQQEELTKWALKEGMEVIGTYQDRCSGKNMGPCRKGLQEAVLHASKSGATILVTSLSRLSRSVKDIANLIDSNTRFVITRNGRQVSKVELLLLAVFAEAESDETSKRVKASIQAKFERDPDSRTKWGRGTDKKAPSDLQRGRINQADNFALKYGVSAYHLRKQIGDDGKPQLTFQDIADIYEAQGILTARGKHTWNAQQMRKLIIRYTRLIEQKHRDFLTNSGLDPDQILGEKS